MTTMLTEEIGAGMAVLAAAVGFGAVASLLSVATGNAGVADVILREWGPLAFATFVLYRRVDRLEQQQQELRKKVNE